MQDGKRSRRKTSLSPLFDRLRHLIPASALGVAVVAPASAQEEPLAVEGIVVTASCRAQQVEDAPASITVIGRERLEGRQYREVTDALRSVPGVIVTGGGRGDDGADIRICTAGPNRFGADPTYRINVDEEVTYDEYGFVEDGRRLWLSLTADFQSYPRHQFCKATDECGCSVSVRYRRAMR